MDISEEHPMRFVGWTFVVLLAIGSQAQAQTAGSTSVPRGTRSYYGTNFGNRYQYFGLGYGYAPGSFGPGGWSAFGGAGGGYSGRRGSGGYGGSRSGRYGYGNYDQQAENLHEQEMMWSMNFAPMPHTTPEVTINPFWNPYQSRLRDDIYHRQEPPPIAEEYENPFVHRQHPTN
jgi:hypothetical protein